MTEQKQIIATKLASFLPGLELNSTPRKYFSVAIGTGPNKNAVIVPKGAPHVSFYITSHWFGMC
jgi:hypothetical protein